jgi:hypothetical protein
MSAERLTIAGSVEFAWAIIAMDTACAWWVDMSRRKPASALVSPGVVARVARNAPPAPSSRPATSSAASQATPKRISRRCGAPSTGAAVSVAPVPVERAISPPAECHP